MAEVIKLGSNGNFGVKEGGTLAYNDENGVFKAIELASSRASGATYVAESGLIADAEVGVPRIDWTNGVGELLLEPQSTNEITYSEEFDNVAWLKTRSTIVANQVVSPDGSQTADELREDSQTGAHYFYDVDYDSSAQNTFSIFAKYKGNNRGLAIGFGGITYFDLNNGVIESIGSDSAKMIAYPNGWYRCIITNDPSSTNDPVFYLYQIGNAGNLTYTGDSSSGIYIWGAQAELASYATSYIPTSGSTATRIQDAVSGNSSLENYINSSEGVLYFEGSALVNDGSSRILALNDGSTSNRIHLFYFVDDNKIYVNYRVSGTSYAIMEAPLTSSLTNNKIAYKFKSGDFALWVNGTEVATDTNTTMIPDGVLDSVQFSQSSGSGSFYGRIRELKVYDTALTDAELTTLTTL